MFASAAASIPLPMAIITRYPSTSLARHSTERRSARSTASRLASTGGVEKFPIRRHFRRRDDTAYEPIVALLPSLPTGSLGDNMAHVLYDSLALEAKVWLNSNSTIDVVLGSSYAERPHDPVHELRRRLLARSRFEPLAPGQRRCFRKLWSYSWSCDRSLRTYGSAAFNETLLLLRSLARHTEAPTPTVIFYARGATRRAGGYTMRRPTLRRCARCMATALRPSIGTRCGVVTARPVADLQ